MATLLPPPSSETPSLSSSMAVAEILRIRRARQQQQETSTRSIQDQKKPKKLRPRLNRSMSERRVPTSLAMHLSSQRPRQSSAHTSKVVEEDEEDEKSMNSMGSMSSCGSNWTIGSTNSMDEKRKGYYQTRRAMSERHLLGIENDFDSDDE